MKLKEGFVIREIEDTIIAVPTGELTNQFTGVITLNKVSRIIWEMLDKGTTIDEIEKILIEKCKTTEENAKKVTEKFVQQLKEANFIEE